ncbi:MAG: RNA methyltransferase [Bacteriovoracaceae bacterium]
MSSNLYLGLVHGPVLNKKGDEVTTSVTNLDIHDIARTCRTFGFKQYFLITPILAQHEMVGKILGHWETEQGTEYNPDRSDALSFIKMQNSVEETIQKITEFEGKKPLIAVTGANFKEYDGTPKDLKNRLSVDNTPLLLLFGTGWGLSASVLNLADFRLVPIFGHNKDGYNHLSVRSAVAIYCDRLWGSL